MKTLIIIALVLQSIGLFIKLMLGMFKSDDIELNGLIGYSMLSIVPTLFFEFLYIYLLCVL